MIALLVMKFTSIIAHSFKGFTKLELEPRRFMQALLGSYSSSIHASTRCLDKVISRMLATKIETRDGYTKCGGDAFFIYPGYESAGLDCPDSCLALRRPKLLYFLIRTLSLVITATPVIRAVPGYR